ncbi:MAG: ISAzo13 family transposase [Desulfamplus sp.]|nr:ISAzo13 family transposase [Desulfamplus sp.]
MYTPKNDNPKLDASIIDDLKKASSYILGDKRRLFQAEMTLKYCDGRPRLAETVFGWNRNTVELGLHEKRTGIICLGAQKACCGIQLWEDDNPEIASVLWDIAESYSQQDPTFRTTSSFTRLTAEEALNQLRKRGFKNEVLPSPSTMADVLNRNGYRLRTVIKAKPQKKIPETDVIFANIKEKDKQNSGEEVTKRISMDAKATVKIGEYSRGGKTRGDNRAADHDMGCTEKYTPFGILDEDSDLLHISFGSSFKTSDFIMDSLYDWWNWMPKEERNVISLLQIKADNGPESNGLRTQFLKRMVEFTDYIGKPVQLLYYPPYHSKYNPVERCWGILEIHWNGTKLMDVDTMLEWAKTMTWKGINPIVNLSRKVYQKGVSVSKKIMQEIENRLERNPLLPKWDIMIRPA